MTTKTAILNVRTDVATKNAAQRAAREIGVSLSTVINARLREFAAYPRVELVPNVRTRRAIDAARKEIREGKGKSFDSVEKFIADLHS
ncbi:MAG: type II toxin-antitoxin system RelB/DinJ family antitoxin [Candidatus Kaiserbacteria bacterium]|nr:type II toxin-antitoxin system RelB/DinJ family antitoxin [Candidatus Kaiserbacteria bacterium]